MKTFLTQTCGCVHVNMNYRLVGNGGGLDAPPNAKLPYEQMLDDIQSVIGYLQAHADVYHVDASKIALMGYSAGGHLAMLYAYSTADNYANSNDNPIKLVVSEAGPTDLTTVWGDLAVNVYAMLGDDSNSLDASPIYQISNNVPFTILAYGNGVASAYNHYNGLNGDSLIPYSQVDAITRTFDGLANSVDRYVLYTFDGVAHEQFGEGNGKVVYPNVAIEENDDAEERALKTVIQNYYNTISNKLQELAE